MPSCRLHEGRYVFVCGLETGLLLVFWGTAAAFSLLLELNPRFNFFQFIYSYLSSDSRLRSSFFFFFFFLKSLCILYSLLQARISFG